MRMTDILAHKRDGDELSTAQINWFVANYTEGNIPDYQASALMMAIYIQGMNRRETVDLTLAMAQSGDTLDLHDVAEFVVDKHSSGGVGDKTTLVVQPLVAACGLPVGKMSGRGLGSSGGTLDKMESIPGWSSALTLTQFKKQIQEIGMALAGQTAVLAPADGKLYALRDVTATVANVSLIAGSIMSKKLASGADGIVLDVKVGSGAFMPTVAKARQLAQAMVDIGVDAGREVVALLSDMNQPLGHAIGNALEVKEAIATLKGEGPEHFKAHCIAVASQMLAIASVYASEEEAVEKVEAMLASGGAFEKFKQLVQAQGGDVTYLDDPERFPKAQFIEPLEAPTTGTIAAMDTGEIGWAGVDLGGGRLVKEDAIDPAVGFVLPAKIGDQVTKGDVLGMIHANDQEKLVNARQKVVDAIKITKESCAPLPHIYEIVRKR